MKKSFITLTTGIDVWAENFCHRSP